MKTIVKFAGKPLNFCTKLKLNMPVASVVAKDGYATAFAGQAAAEVAVKNCKLDETKVTYHLK
jgi:hypothetical protein